MEDGEWMYTGWSRTQGPSNDWIENTNRFLDHTFSRSCFAAADAKPAPPQDKRHPPHTVFLEGESIEQPVRASE
jgi:hypothetical protein